MDTLTAAITTYCASTRDLRQSAELPIMDPIAANEALGTLRALLRPPIAKQVVAPAAADNRTAAGVKFPEVPAVPVPAVPGPGPAVPGPGPAVPGPGPADPVPAVPGPEPDPALTPKAAIIANLATIQRVSPTVGIAAPSAAVEAASLQRVRSSTLNVPGIVDPSREQVYEYLKSLKRIDAASNIITVKPKSARRRNRRRRSESKRLPADSSAAKSSNVNVYSARRGSQQQVDRDAAYAMMESNLHDMSPSGPFSDTRAKEIEAALSALCFSATSSELKFTDNAIFSDPMDAFAGTAGSLDIDGSDLKYRKVIKESHPERAIWYAASDKELVRNIEERRIYHPIFEHQKPSDRLASYCSMVAKKKFPDVNDTSIFDARVRSTYGGNRSDYEGERSANTSSMTDVKLLLNKTISTPGRKFVSADITDFYLIDNPLERPEYMRLQLADVSPWALNHFQFEKYILPGATSVLLQVDFGIYGLPQSGLLAQKKLKAHLADHGYVESVHTPCHFKHATDLIEFVLIVDDIGISTHGDGPAERLFDVLRKRYPLKVDMTGSKFLGFKLEFNYSDILHERYCKLSMPGYVTAALKRFDIVLTHPVHAAEAVQPISYGSSEAQRITVDNSDPLDAAGLQRLQQITGTILYYARAVDAMLLTSIGRVGSRVSHPTKNALLQAEQVLKHMGTYPDATIVYYASDMLLEIFGDASYNSERNARSRGGGFFHCARYNDPAFINGPILCVSTLIPTVVSSAAEAEYATLFINGRLAIPLRQTLDDMNCIQGRTRMITDNETAEKIVNGTCELKRAKSMDMRYHWLRQRCVEFKEFDIVWDAGRSITQSIADFLTKPHPAKHTAAMRRYFVQDCGPSKIAVPCSRATRA